MLKIKRLLAVCIDFFIVVLVSSLISSVFIFNNISDSSSVFLTLVGVLIYICVGFLLLITKDVLFGNASMGKKIFGLGIYDKNKKPVVDKRLLIKRNIALIFTFPIDILTILIDNKRKGDVLCNTQVLSNKSR